MLAVHAPSATRASSKVSLRRFATGKIHTPRPRFWLLGALEPLCSGRRCVGVGWLPPNSATFTNQYVPPSSRFLLCTLLGRGPRDGDTPAYLVPEKLGLHRPLMDT